MRVLVLELMHAPNGELTLIALHGWGATPEYTVTRAPRVQSSNDCCKRPDAAVVRELRAAAVE
jgi:hypothetical protein